MFVKELKFVFQFFHIIAFIGLRVSKKLTEITIVLDTVNSQYCYSISFTFVTLVVVLVHHTIIISTRCWSSSLHWDGHGRAEHNPSKNI